VIGYDISVEGLEEQIQKLVEFDLIAEKHLKTAMQKSVLTIEGEVKPLVPVGVSARLKNSIGTTVLEIGTLSLEGRVGSSLKSELYPQVMEFGREPGKMPPPEALTRWVHLKLGVPKEDELRVAYLVARKIKSKGIKAKEFMKTGFENAKDRVVRFFNQALDDIAQDLTNGRN
jgi:hypothetical protein